MNAKILSAMAGVAVASTALAQGPAAGLRLTDGNHVYQVGTSTATTFPTGNVLATTATSGSIISANFFVPRNTVTTSVTGTDHLFNDWWFFRFNSGGPGAQTREFAFTAPTARVAGSNTGSYTFTLATGVTALLEFTLTNQGALQANILRSVTITNNSGGAIALNLFNSFDLDLNGAATDTYATPGGYTVGTAADRTINVSDGAYTAQAIGYGSIAYGAGVWNVNTALMTDAAVTNYTDPAMPAVGDNSMGFQWLLNLADGQSATVSSALALSGLQGTLAQAIPTPGAMALLGLGGLAATRRRRA